MRRALLTLLLLAGCAQPELVQAADRPEAAPRGETPQPRGDGAQPRWHAVLVAGDPSLEVWDRAVERMEAGLRASGRLASLQRFSARRERLAAGAQPAIRKPVLAAIAGLRPGPGEACLIFLTMHGAPGRGLVFAAEPGFLTPPQLDAALAQGCGQAPSFVIASGCFTGGFAAAPMARANRVVLTAARPDRSSFGCAPQFELTVFDRCVLDSLDATPPTANALAKSTADCVAREERRENMTPPSEPQAAIGAAVGGLLPRLSPR
jgi:hypothetical protein